LKKVIAGISIVAATLFAADNYEFGLGLGHHNVSNSPMDDYKFINARFGKYLPHNHILRLEVESSETVMNSDDSLSRVLLNVEHYFNTDTKITPYAFVGIGYQMVQGDYDSNGVADLGIGAKYGINKSINAFLEIRGLRDFGNNDNHFGAIVGLSFQFGAEKEETPKKVVLDSDKDGVNDENDKCANTPANVKVDANGCALDSDKDGVADYLDKCANTPANVKVDANGCALDSDKDGVADYLDKCANTPANVKVDANGCALDSDKDGVADYLDKCPNTSKDFKVDKTGCPLSFNFKITFAKNSNVITSEFMPKVEELAKFLKENPKYKVEIQGYTDNTGSETYNKKLSEKRAKAVYEALINLGVSKDRVSYKGYGSENPIASNDTTEGRLANRRVVAKLSY